VGLTYISIKNEACTPKSEISILHNDFFSTNSAPVCGFLLFESSRIGGEPMELLEYKACWFTGEYVRMFITSHQPRMLNIILRMQNPRPKRINSLVRRRLSLFTPSPYNSSTKLSILLPSPSGREVCFPRRSPQNTRIHPRSILKIDNITQEDYTYLYFYLIIY